LVAKTAYEPDLPAVLCLLVSTGLAGQPHTRARDEILAARLNSLAEDVKKGSGDATTKKRRAALAEALSGIAVRLC